VPELVPSSFPSSSTRGAFRQKKADSTKEASHKVCCFCKKPKKVHAWITSNDPVCTPCYQKYINVEECSQCGKLDTVRARDSEGGAICHKCYQRNRTEEICVTCGDFGKIVKRLDDGGQCSACYQRERRQRLKSESKPS